ncbi:MAG: hypothetical protein K0S96_1986, partial [Geminicoccaceae bacterium]|nr:hypothetical protein [Geminicoccaceae bacterium]
MSWPRAATDAINQPLPAKEPLWPLMRDLRRALTQDDPVAYRYLLLLRFVLANSLALALVGAAAGQG